MHRGGVSPCYINANFSPFRMSSSIIKCYLEILLALQHGVSGISNLLIGEPFLAHKHTLVLKIIEFQGARKQKLTLPLCYLIKIH